LGFMRVSCLRLIQVVFPTAQAFAGGADCGTAFPFRRTDPGAPAMTAASSGEPELNIAKAHQNNQIRFVMHAGAGSE
jgi:hypothetical protein